jgi:hypothetical protein
LAVSARTTVFDVFRRSGGRRAVSVTARTHSLDD